MDEVLGLKLLEKERAEIPDKIKKLVKERETARKNRNFKKADELRDKIKKEGYLTEDTKEGVKILKNKLKEVKCRS